MISKYPEGDTWTLVDKDPESQHYGKNFHFHFEDLCSEEIKDAVKLYVWGNYVTGNRTLNNLCTVLKLFKWFNRYAIQVKIQSLRELTNFNICKFVSFLNTAVSKKTGKKLSYQSRKKFWTRLRVCFIGVKFINLIQYLILKYLQAMSL